MIEIYQWIPVYILPKYFFLSMGKIANIGSLWVNDHLFRNPSKLQQGWMKGLMTHGQSYGCCHPLSHDQTLATLLTLADHRGLQPCTWLSLSPIYVFGLCHPALWSGKQNQNYAAFLASSSPSSTPTFYNQPLKQEALLFLLPSFCCYLPPFCIQLLP